MSLTNLASIEKNKKFKSYILNKNVWKNYAFIPPALVLFTGLFGLVYLYKDDILISWYSVPFIIIFAIGTIWFKATRKYLLNKKLEETDSFLVCTSTILATKGRRSIILFTTNNNRHNSNYIQKQKKEILENSDFSKKSAFDKAKKNEFTLIKDNEIYTALVSENKKDQLVTIINKDYLVSVKASQLTRFTK